MFVDPIDQRNTYVKTSIHRDLLSEMYETKKAFIFDSWKRGVDFSNIAKIMGLSPGTVFTALRNTRGIKQAQRKRAARHLTLAEREEIRVALSAKKSLRVIARLLGRAHSTILREVQRN